MNELSLKIIKYEKNDISIDVRYDEVGNTIWLSTSEIAKILNKDRSWIGKIIKEIGLKNTKIWAYTPTSNKRMIKGNHRNTSIYNLSVIEAIYSKTKSSDGLSFIKWANELIHNVEPTTYKPYEANNYEIITFVDNDFKLDVNVSPNENTVWLNQDEIAYVFQTTKANISMHISNIFKENELEKSSVVKESLTTASDGKKYNITFYNLDVIFTIGARVKSQRGKEFRKWARNILSQYLLHGYAISDKRCQECHEQMISLSNKVDNMKKTISTTDDRLSKISSLFKKESLLVGIKVIRKI